MSRPVDRTSNPASLDPTFDPDAPGALGEGIFGLPHTPEQARLIVIPVPFEATTSYGRGTANAPARVLEASKQVELNDPQTGDPWKAGIAMLPIDPAVQAWNDEGCALSAPIVAAGGAHTPELRERLAKVNAIGGRLNDWVYARTEETLDAGKIPGILGGDHAVSFGAIKAAAERYKGLGILHVDAHADAREAYEGFTWSHASIFYNVHERIPHLGQIVQVGIRDFGVAEAERIEQWTNLTAFTDTELGWELMSGEPWQRIAARVVRPLPKKVWVSFDIDGLDPSLCPKTGTPVPGGLGWREALMLLQLLAEDHQIVGFDLVEIGDGEWDANVGARLLYKLAGWALSGAT
ncbi:MAG: agmatinase family protein [Myxococcota bacterium]